MSTLRSELPAELASLGDRFVLAESVLRVAGTDVTLERPHKADELIREDEFLKDERLPYWADVWPSSTALATVVAGLDGTGRRALELGCGLGLVAIGALMAGYDVLATDYYDDALLFARRNALRNLDRAPETRMVNWRYLPRDLGRFDLVLASDVLYEKPYAEMMAEAIDYTLAPRGRALIADPGRLAVPDFLAACAARGLAVRILESVPWEDPPARQTINIHEVVRL